MPGPRKGEGFFQSSPCFSCPGESLPAPRLVLIFQKEIVSRTRIGASRAKQSLWRWLGENYSGQGKLFVPSEEAHPAPRKNLAAARATLDRQRGNAALVKICSALAKENRVPQTGRSSSGAEGSGGGKGRFSPAGAKRFPRQVSRCRFKGKPFSSSRWVLTFQRRISFLVTETGYFVKENHFPQTRSGGVLLGFVILFFTRVSGCLAYTHIYVCDPAKVGWHGFGDASRKPVWCCFSKLSFRETMPLLLGEVVAATLNQKRAAQYRPVVAEIQEEKHMDYAKIGLDDLTVPAKIQYGRRLIAGINDNPTLFPAPNPSVLVLTAKVDGVETAYNEALAARLNAKSLTQLLQDQVDSFANSVSLLASYVDNISAGDRAVIERSGFSLRAAPTPVGPLPAPTNLRSAPGDHVGHAVLRWTAVYGAKSYNIERAEDGAELKWSFLASSTKREAQVNSMISGKTYWHRVAAVGASGQSPWSVEVPMLAL